MERVVEASHEGSSSAAGEPVSWRLSGERRKQGAAEAQTWLRLVLDARLNLTCQRCLGAVDTRLTVDRWIRFVAGEKLAAEIDAESEEDVLASTRSLDLHELAEDELLLALPLVPRHEVCTQPLLPSAGAASVGDVADESRLQESPFSALAALKRGTH